MRIVEEFHITIRKNIVFKLMDCHDDSPIYDLIEKTYKELEKTIYNYIEPKAFILYSRIGERETNILDKYGNEFFYVINTIGEKLEVRSAKYFDEGRYLEAILQNAMADDYLFQMDEVLADILKDESAKYKKGIKQRLEAPDDIPIEFHKTVYEQVDEANRHHLRLTSGYMFEPVKTCCYVLVLSDNLNQHECQHDCGKCRMTDCKLRSEIFTPSFDGDTSS